MKRFTHSIMWHPPQQSAIGEDATSRTGETFHSNCDINKTAINKKVLLLNITHNNEPYTIDLSLIHI